MGGGRDRGSGGMEGRTEREDGAKVGEDHTEDKRETEIQRDIHTERDTENTPRDRDSTKHRNRNKDRVMEIERETLKDLPTEMGTRPEHR